MNADQLAQAIGCTTGKAALHLPYFEKACELFGITTPQALAAFIATIGHESRGLAWDRELWGPTDAQRRYEPPWPLAKKLGNSQPGDGRRFAGRTWIQLTGRANYARMQSDLQAALPRLASQVPDFLADPDAACRTGWNWLISAQFFASRGCIELANAGDFHAVCVRVNGGENGLQDRTDRYNVALQWVP